MQKLFLPLLMLLSVAACKTMENVQIDPPACIQERIDQFRLEEKSRQVESALVEGDTIFKFKSLLEDVFLNQHCDTVCQYYIYSSFLPPCKQIFDQSPSRLTIWIKE